MTAYLPREIAPRLAKALQTLPVVVVSGLRQAGKSTLLQAERSLSTRRAYRTLDDFAVLAAARSHPESLLEGRVTLDEVQRCPSLLIAIKRAVDQRREPGRFVLSGSANLALLGQVTETLAGRAGYYTLAPMTRREIRGTTKRPPFLAAFLRKPHLPAGAAEPIHGNEVLLGGLPPVCLGAPDAAGEWFRGYVQTYLERDLRQLAQVADLVSFRALA
jgi:predicted AAA+ superfamily ATPase